MIKVVIDTNVVVSANLVTKGPSAAILRLALKKSILMFISPAVLAEYEDVLSRPRLKFTPDFVKNLVSRIRETAGLVHPANTLKISADEDDNRFYECADAAQADYLITGNAEDFPTDYGPTKIISPRDFLDRVALLFADNDPGRHPH